MHIRFKFRSAVDFDVVDIGDRAWISVMELKSKIIAYKHLNLCDDFDLVFSDLVTGQEYKDETYQIPSNSSVVIKRVPAAPPYDLAVNLGMKSNILHEKSGGIDDFDGFGIDSCVVQHEILPHSVIESKRKTICDNKEENVAGSRSRCQKRQAGDLVQAVSKDFDQDHTKGKFPPEKLEPKIQEHVKLEKRPIDLYELAEQNASLPSELRCSICNKYLREAVMIPCCQHSFCERCIRGVLSEKAKCPRCSSHKFTEKNLLPNLSLRQTIEHFLELQNEFSISENALRRFAPDEESGIHASAVTRVQKRPKNLIGGEGDGYAQHACSQNGTGNQPGIADFQGENDPVHLPQIYVQERGDDGNFTATARYRKADRTCYMCNASDHFIRDCPFANSSHSMPQAGYSMCAVGGMETHMTPYWKDTAFGPMTPYTTMYGNTGMMPLNASLYPVSPIDVYPYMSYMYGHIPVFGGDPRMAGMAPLMGSRSENSSTHAKLSETQKSKIRENHANEYMMRKRPCDDEDEDIQTSHQNLLKSSEEYLSHAARENSGSYFGRKHTRNSQGTELHGKHFYQDVHSVHDPYGKNSHSLTGTRHQRAYQTDIYDGERHSHNHYNVTGNHHERRGHYGGDSSWSRHHGEKDKKKVLSEDKGFIKKHGRQFGPILEPSYSGDENKWCKRGDHRQGSNRYRDGSEYIQNELFCRSKRVRRDDDCREDYYQPKRKRVH